MLNTCRMLGYVVIVNDVYFYMESIPKYFFYDSLQNVNFDKWYQKCILDDMHSFLNEDEFSNIS